MTPKVFKKYEWKYVSKCLDETYKKEKKIQIKIATSKEK